MATVLSYRHPPRQHAPLRPAYRAARAFYLTLLIGTIFATYAFYLRPRESRHDVLGLSTRNLSSPAPNRNADEECRLVHHASDQCAFVQDHCPTGEVSFEIPLKLFYCELSHAQPFALLVLVVWLALLFSTIGIAASDFFCINLSTIASILGMSESMTGVTFLAFGNGSPDVFSTFAAMNTHSGSLAVGELFGAAGFITAVVAGSMALIRPFHVAKKSFIRDVGFFAVASAFSMVFLWDGQLHFWECVVMVGFYIFYVTFVVVWHWLLSRRRRKRTEEAAAREHFVALGDERNGVERYYDDPQEAERPNGVSRGGSRENFSALERGHGGVSRTGTGISQANDGTADEDDEEEARDRWMSELSSNMRLTRPVRSRRNTLNPVRPSLVGALEFQAVLNSLQKSRNHQTIPLDSSRRYSDDPSFTTAQLQDEMRADDEVVGRPSLRITVDDSGAPLAVRTSLDVPPRSAPARTRAVSVSHALDVDIDEDLRRPDLEIKRQGYDSVVEASTTIQRPRMLLDIPSDDGARSLPQSPTLEVTPASPPTQRPPLSGRRAESSALLTPDPTSAHLNKTHFGSDFYFPPRSNSRPRSRTDASPIDSPRTVPFSKDLPRISIPHGTRSRRSSPLSSPFPRYHDDVSPGGSDRLSRPPSLYLPPAIASPETLPVDQSYIESDDAATQKKPTAWWPYTVLPPPGILVATLFPTIYHWPEKTWWEKLLGIVAAPSVFLLTITLPVVENEKDEDGEVGNVDASYDSAKSRSKVDRGAAPHSHGHGINGHVNAADVVAGTERQHRHLPFTDDNEDEASTLLAASPAIIPLTDPTEAESHEEPEPWNRWLTVTQLFLAPLFILLSLYIQSSPIPPARWLLQPMLISLLCSTITLIPFLLTTTTTHRPAFYIPLLSLAGFVVSIAWISTIASQVVGALKALAVILNMSHAIMGLTIFAVGNSLGDLVADVTVARLGYPVMALSACFGGPMLNILLGIGASGSWILWQGAKHREERHPDKDFKMRAYHIEVSPTLVVSGATLLITLLGLLVAVPVNKWVLDKRIGWGLIGLWTLSTIGNVVLEVSGWADRLGTEGWKA